MQLIYPGKDADIRVGDWLRFYKSGVLVIGVVQYVRPLEALAPSQRVAGPYFSTDLGEVSALAVVEVRR